jgi:hypothetical protein
MQIKTYSWDEGLDDTGSKLTKPRRIANKQTWTIDLHTSDIDSRCAPPNSVIESATYGIGKVPSSAETGPINRYQLNAYPCFSLPILKHTCLTVTDTEALDYPFNSAGDLAWLLRDLSGKLAGATRLELMLLDEDERPARYNELIFDRNYGNFEVVNFKWSEHQIPEGWSIFDDELVKQLDYCGSSMSAKKPRRR